MIDRVQSSRNKWNKINGFRLLVFHNWVIFELGTVFWPFYPQIIKACPALQLYLHRSFIYLHSKLMIKVGFMILEMTIDVMTYFWKKEKIIAVRMENEKTKTISCMIINALFSRPFFKSEEFYVAPTSVLFILRNIFFYLCLSRTFGH